MDFLYSIRESYRLLCTVPLFLVFLSFSKSKIVNLCPRYRKHVLSEVEWIVNNKVCYQPLKLIFSFTSEE